MLKLYELIGFRPRKIDTKGVDQLIVLVTF